MSESQNLDEIEYLSRASGFSKRKCAAVLSQSQGDVEEAEAVLNKLKDNIGERALDFIISYVTLERGKVLRIMDGDEVLISLPYIFVVFILGVLGFTSRIIGMILFVILLFGMDIKTETINKKTDEVDSKFLFKRRPNEKEKPAQPVTDALNDNEEYNEFSVE